MTGPSLPQQTNDAPVPFDGYEYRVTYTDGSALEPCHAMPSFSSKGVLLVVPTVNGEGGALAGDLRDPRIASVERTGVHKQSWVDAKTGKQKPDATCWRIGFCGCVDGFCKRPEQIGPDLMPEEDR